MYATVPDDARRFPLMLFMFILNAEKRCLLFRPLHFRMRKNAMAVSTIHLNHNNPLRKLSIPLTKAIAAKHKRKKNMRNGERKTYFAKPLINNSRNDNN